MVELVELLKEFARTIARGAVTRAVVNRVANTLTVYTVGESAAPDAVVVAYHRRSKQFVIGPISYPAPGWVEIDDTAYPTSRIEVRGPVLFVVTPIPPDLEQGTKGGQHGSV